MSLRIGFDLDGVLADFASAYRDVEAGLFGADQAPSVAEPAEEEEQQNAAAADQSSKPSRDRSRRDAIWRQIQSTPDFWLSLKPTDPLAVRRIHDLMMRYRWEVFFITQRPATQGDTVQRQTQRWLVSQGFDLPSVLVIGGSRGAAAGALRLDYHVDDSATNCLDVLSDAQARPILVVGSPDGPTARRAKSLGIGVAVSIDEALKILEHASTAGRDPGILQRLASLVGWK
jgi:hypothetical protein